MPICSPRSKNSQLRGYRLNGTAAATGTSTKTDATTRTALGEVRAIVHRGSDHLELPTLFWRQLEVIGSSMNDRSDFAEAVRVVAAGAVEVPVAASLPFDRYPEALGSLERGEQIGKLILVR